VTRPGTIGFGKAYPEFWINLRAGQPRVAPESGAHISACAARPQPRSMRFMLLRSQPAEYPMARPA